MTKQKTIRQLSFKSLTDVSEGKQSIVRAVLTAPVEDSDGEIYDTYTMRVPLKGGGYKLGADLDGTEDLNITFVTNHDLATGGINRDVRETIGRVMRGKLNDQGEFVVDLFFSSIKEAQDMYTLVIEGCLDDCLSLVYWHYGEDTDGIIRNAEPFQLGIVWKSANQRARVIASSKSLKEGNIVTKIDVEAKKKQLAAKQAEVDAAQDEVAALESEIESAEKPEGDDADADAQAKQEQEAKEAADAAELAEKETEEAEEKRKAEAEAAEKVEKKEVTKNLSTKASASKPNSDVRQEEEQMDTTERKALAVKAMGAIRRNDSGAAMQIEKELEKTADTDTKKLADKAAADGRATYGGVTGEGTSNSFLQAELDAEAAKLYETVGGIVKRVTKKSLTGNSTEYRKRIKRDRLQYAPAPYGKNKKVQHVLPAWAEFKVQPWAVIAAWDEEIAEDSPYDYFAEVTEDLVDGALWNEEFMILGFAGGVFGGRTYAPTGILPILKTAGGRYAQYTIDSTFVKKLTEAYGNIVSTSRNPKIGLAMTRKTRANLAGIQDADGNLLFTGDGDKINLGLLGEVYIEEVEARNVPDNQILIGDFSQYYDLEKGGVRILGSQHATLDSVSLFQSDGEALRGRQRIGGGPLFKEAFYVLGTAAVGTGIVLPAQPTADV